MARRGPTGGARLGEAKDFLMACLLFCAGAAHPAPAADRGTAQAAYPGTAAGAAFGRVDASRLGAADREPEQWFTVGRDGGQTYFSPLDDINDKTAARLGFAWQYTVGTHRGLEATPIVVDGVMYTSGNWGRVYALDGATGRELWTYDPGVDGRTGRDACCDAVNRGVAVWKGRVYVVSLDGYLHAIDARTGKRVWRVDTLPERGANAFRYSVTGAPVVAGDAIVIGNGGSDFKGARGSISAYSLDSGKFRWRFFTVPRDPKLGAQDQPHLDEAVKTWPAKYDWGYGGGGTAWDGLAYDAGQHLVYLGSANASPYHGLHDPAGSGDELYVASIIAVHSDTGRMAWYYQEIPGEGSDYDTMNKLVLADLSVDGKPRKVIMQASKDGFLYVLDRVTGEFLEGKQFARVNWTKGLDPKTHRPIMDPSVDWGRAPTLMYPSAVGAHNWQPTSFSPRTGLFYIPVIDAPMVYVDTTHRPMGLIEGSFDLAFFSPEDYDPKSLASLFGKLPSLESLSPGGTAPKSRGLIRAIQPQTGAVVWEQPTATHWDGGLLSTGGNLLIAGDAAGFLNVYSADHGKLLKRIDVGTSILAAPMTYRIGAVQYLAVMAGYGGGVLYLPFPPESAAYRYGNEGRIVAFRLDGGVTPKPAPYVETRYAPPAREGNAAAIAHGELLYNRYCARCHTFGRALLPDLSNLPPGMHAMFYDIVLKGALQANGMARWDDVLSHDDAAAIHAYLVDQAWQAQGSASSTAAH
ncbi:MAG TPA: PQQ-dependent dehydrogenase, methanol/ethanol family [Steroidobacteraceae bacterium]|jgi:quinohemoprotein ethanol dehydrogenase|nr:PQQ-dependent dehydrogenase, methanol/ethanol family [Steroidobacteraceae bacterium]